MPSSEGRSGMFAIHPRLPTHLRPPDLRLRRDFCGPARRNPDANGGRRTPCDKLPGLRRGRLVGWLAVLHLYDTATRSVRELALREPGKVSIYLCGPTVDGPAHLGHGRATLTYDILRRYLEWSGIEVRLVSNVTDIDDKI